MQGDSYGKECCTCQGVSDSDCPPNVWLFWRGLFMVAVILETVISNIPVKAKTEVAIVYRENRSTEILF